MNKKIGLKGRLLATLLLMTTAFSAELVAAKSVQVSDAQIKQKIIQQSIADYPGPCACPYNSARNGSACGRRSAWSRRGGYAPKCYPADVTKQMIQQWKASH